MLAFYLTGRILSISKVFLTRTKQEFIRIVVEARRPFVSATEKLSIKIWNDRGFVDFIVANLKAGDIISAQGSPRGTSSGVELVADVIQLVSQEGTVKNQIPVKHREGIGDFKVTERK